MSWAGVIETVCPRCRRHVELTDDGRCATCVWYESWMPGAAEAADGGLMTPKYRYLS